MLRVRMVPSLDKVKGEESGIRRVVEAYHRYLPDYGVELVGEEIPREEFDLLAVHAGTFDGPCDVSHCHGLYWTADYRCESWEWWTNARVIKSLRHAREITVPSDWVAETLRRDMRLNPHVIPHGIEWEAWQGYTQSEGYVLWNKNRMGDTCDPRPVVRLADRFPDLNFVTTMEWQKRDNIFPQGLVDHAEMRRLVKQAGVYLSTTKETFGIGTLEAMASGVPVLGWAEGGNLILVEHGVNGYLAEPRNYDDLAEGLHYCLQHAETLGTNGREMARQWTWPRACEQVAHVYELAARPRKPTAAVIIPTYNYAEKVGRAIESAIGQDYAQLEEIIVVDDGSDDQGATEAVVREWAAKDARVRYVRQANAGVAAARNRGISEASAQYVSCLDADDAIQPGFLSVCIDALERDRSLGIAYTGLWYIKPDGEEGQSPWPGEFDYDAQIRRRNQIPTCCVFRREMWERLGGYKSRYCPKGAGSEDAEFWTRAGAYGFGAKRAINKPLFVYSWQSGRVSGDPDYREIDWLGWHPWAKDGKHPFASVATPDKWSHPVRQYDQPLVSVVIPVGPDHGHLLENALDSLEAQTFRRWEAILVWDGPRDPEQIERVLRPYPYVRSYIVDGEPQGAGYARNRGAELARAPFLVFLDADDWLYPEYLERSLKAWPESNAIVYTNYVGKAFIDDPSNLAPELQRRVYRYDQDTGEAVIGYRAWDFDPERAQAQPEVPRPYIWCNVTALVPKAWHEEISGFDEAMQSWEDADYHWRMVMAGKCYYHLEQELMVYRFWTGARRERGLQDHRQLVQYLQDKYAEIEPVGCKCKGNSKTQTRQPAAVVQQAAPSGNGKAASMNDENYVKVRYNHPNRGQHTVIGASTRTKYGFRGGGEVFYVHRDDVNAQPHLFEPITPEIPKSPRPRIPPPPPPQETPSRPAMPEPVEAPERGADLQLLPGVNADIEAQMIADGLESLEDVLALGEAGLQKYTGIGKVRAASIIDAIEKLQAQ